MSDKIAVSLVEEGNAEKHAKETLNETEETRTSGLHDIKKWLTEEKTNLHARLEDQYILPFLRGCKFDLKKTKAKLKRFYKMRRDVPEWFRNRDPSLPELQELMKLGCFVPLRRFHENKLVVIVRVAVHNPRIHQQNDVFKLGNMLTDVAAMEYAVAAQIYGVVAIFDIAVGVHEATARRAIRKYEQTGSTARRILLSGFYGIDQILVNVQQDLRQICDVAVSKQTVCRRLKEVNLKARSPAKGPKLFPEHRAARRNFVENYGQWYIPEWSNVLFTDESRRRTGERFNQNSITECDSFDGGSVIGWGGISMNGKTPLHVFPVRQSMNAQIYIDISEQIMPRPHTAAIVRNFLEATGITTLQWPARSPDMNPIEHLWDELGRRVRYRKRSPESLAEMADALVEEWDRIPMETISNLISSMPRRLEVLRVASGGNTRY
ncbi:unnamed protein product [Phaedon cochleariae]|uniref:CRAL/TRIO N-terminal domain-containing protein n=1 Tax=Phaedon cochleariae TaxID=80249 RepID=A0A9N9SEK0_PHACE|nr:unnamed protein product [Phaedon cochleariae]